MSSSPEVSPGTCFIPLYHTSSCSSKLKRCLKKKSKENWIYILCRCFLCIFSRSVSISAMPLHAWCNTTEEPGVTLMKKIHIIEAVHSWGGKKGNNTATHAHLLYVHTPLTSVKTFPPLTSFPLLCWTCAVLPYLHKRSSAEWVSRHTVN